MPKALNLVGEKYGMLTVLERAGQTKAGQYQYRCLCECGNETITRTGCLRNGHVRSCGCLSKIKGKRHVRFKHGLSDKSHPENKRYQRECFDKYKYNLLPEHKQALIDKQENACAICAYKFGQKVGDMKVDHCHSTGVVRGLLCDLCNRGLGYFRDQADRLINAANYLTAR
jgi:hypothetical protein